MPVPDRIPRDVATFLALDPDELGLRMLPRLVTALSAYQAQLEVTTFRALVTGFQLRLGSPGNGPFPESSRAEIIDAFDEAWFWLEGQALLIPDLSYQQPTTFRKLSRRARRLAAQREPERVFHARVLNKASLNSIIAEDVVSSFIRGRYDVAVFEAMRAVEIAVRSAGGFAETDLGVPMMRRAFDPERGPLTDMSATYQEREARAALFAGTIGSYKNPQSHRKVDLNDPDEAAELIYLANHLLRIVDSRTAGE